MCSVQGGVQLLKDVAGVIASPLRILSNKEESSDSDSEDEDGAQQRRQLPLANTATPQTLCFTAPEDAEPGKPVCVQGPHGPIMLPLPADVRPGKPCSVRLGPDDHYTVKVPKGKEPGTLVEFSGVQGETLHALVPVGAKEGDEFKVSPPVVLVQVPRGVQPGQQVVYNSPLGQQLVVVVPPGLSPGHYFSALYEVGPMQQAPQALQAAPPQSQQTMQAQPGSGYPQPQQAEKAEAHPVGAVPKPKENKEDATFEAVE